MREKKSIWNLKNEQWLWLIPTIICVYKYYFVGEMGYMIGSGIFLVMSRIAAMHYDLKNK